MEEARQKASQTLEKQVKQIDTLKLANQKLWSDNIDLSAKLAKEETTRTVLAVEKTAILVDKAKVKAFLDELK